MKNLDNNVKALKWLQPEKQKRLWEKLRSDSVVPVVSKEMWQDRSAILSSLIQDIRTHNYFPEPCHGFLGVCKSNGCTRFLPVMTVRDMSVYYACVSAIQDEICISIEGVFGGWRMRKEKQREEDDNDEIFGDYVFEGSLSTKKWIQNWRRYTDLIESLCDTHSEEYYFHTTDIANFYDSINLDILENKLKRTCEKWDESIDILVHFLKHWNRRITGYNPSSKGIPQESVQDASRILANFYLRDFDITMKELAEDYDCHYIRWSDDMVFFGLNKAILEELVHKASKELLKCGLHLNAYKTKCYSKEEYKKFRCVDVLKKINSNKYEEIELGIEWFKERLNEGTSLRKDTVYRNLITVLSNPYTEWEKRNEYRRWLKNSLVVNWETLTILDASKLVKLFSFYSDLCEGMKEVTSIIIEKPYASPKAELVKALKKVLYNKSSSDLTILCAKEQLSIIIDHSKDSEIIQRFCIDGTGLATTQATLLPKS